MISRLVYKKQKYVFHHRHLYKEQWFLIQASQISANQNCKLRTTYRTVMLPMTLKCQRQFNEIRKQKAQWQAVDRNVPVMNLQRIKRTIKDNQWAWLVQQRPICRENWSYPVNKLWDGHASSRRRYRWSIATRLSQ